MTNNVIENYITLTRSPIILSPILETFYHNLNPFPKNILLSYLVLPLVTFPSSRDFLCNSNLKSSIRTLCKKNESLLGLNQRVIGLKSVTNRILKNAINNNQLVLNEDLSLSIHSDKINLPINNLSPEIKAAQKLTKFFELDSIPAIYRQLGVTCL